MTPELLEAQSRAAIKAWCDDPSVQIEYKVPESDVWFVCNHYEAFNLRAYHYRIAKPRKWYRVAKMKFENGEEYPEVACHCDASPIEKMSGFIEWITIDRVYYD